jgi:membrane protein required for colicin V production
MMLDIVTMVVLAYAGFRGMERGLLVSAFSFASLFVGLVAAMYFSSTVAEWLSGMGAIPVRWLPFLAFLGVYALVRWLVGMAGRMIKASAEALMLGGLDKAGGVLLHMVLYGTVYSIVLFYLRQLGFLGEDTVSESRSYPWIAPWAPWVLELLSGLFPFLGEMVRALKEYFRDTAGAIPAPKA